LNFGLCKVKQKDISFFLIYIYDISDKKRTKLAYISYALHLYFNGLYLRNTSKALSRLVHKRSHTAIINGIQKYKPKRLFCRKATDIGEFIIYETQLKVSSELIWLC
jgi:transposase-like protein